MPRNSLTRMARCPVKPIALGNGKRLERYDIHRLDEWIDTFDRDSASRSKDWLTALDSENDDHSRERN